MAPLTPFGMKREVVQFEISLTKTRSSASTEIIAQGVNSRVLQLIPGQVFIVLELNRSISYRSLFITKTVTSLNSNVCKL